MPLSSGWARVSSMQVFSFVTGGSCLKRPSLAHVTSREYRITLPGSAQLLSKIVDLPGKVARRDHGRSVPAAPTRHDEGPAFYGILPGPLVLTEGEPVAVEEIDSATVRETGRLYV